MYFTRINIELVVQTRSFLDSNRVSSFLAFGSRFGEFIALKNNRLLRAAAPAIVVSTTFIYSLLFTHNEGSLARYALTYWDVAGMYASSGSLPRVTNQYTIRSFSVILFHKRKNFILMNCKNFSAPPLVLNIELSFAIIGNMSCCGPGHYPGYCECLLQ
jgi:hypothetical protein